MPAEQTEADDCKRLIDLAYVLLTTFTLDRLKAMTSGEDLKALFNSQTNPAYHLPNNAGYGHPTEWSVRRQMFVHGIERKCRQRAEEIFRMRSSTPSDAITDFHQCDLNNLLEGGLSTQMLNRLKQSMMSYNASTDDDAQLKFELDSLFGGISNGIDIANELPGLSHLQIHPENDMIVFNDGRNAAQLQAQGFGPKNKLVGRKCTIAFYNKKTITFYLLVREIKKIGLRWHKNVHGAIIRDLLGSGTLYRIGYGTDGNYCVVGTYTSEDIIHECANQKFIWNCYYSGTESIESYLK